MTEFEPSFPDEVECFVVGCDFTAESTDREGMEQHVRWIHLREYDFGEDPFPAMTGFVLNGLIRPEEFAAAMQAILTRAWKAERRRRPTSRRGTGLYAVFLLICVLGVAGLVALTWDDNSLATRLELAPVLVSIAIGAALSLVFFRGW